MVVVFFLSYILEDKMETLHGSAKVAVANFQMIFLCCRTCRTRTSTGTRLAFSAASAGFPWLTSSSAVKPTKSTAATATMLSSLPDVTDVDRFSEQVSYIPVQYTLPFLPMLLPLSVLLSNRY